MKPQETAPARIGGSVASKRVFKRVKCTSPDGVVEWHTPNNAADLQAYHKWAVDYSSSFETTNPKQVAPAPVVAQPTSQVEEPETDAPVETRVKPLTPAELEFKALQDKAASLGIEVDPNWGKNKLKAAINAADK